MNKIEFPRTGADGKSRTKELAERWYRISSKLNFATLFSNIKGKNSFERKLLDCLQINIDKTILTQSPQELQQVVNKFKAETYSERFPKRKTKKETPTSYTFSSYLKSSRGTSLRNRIQKALEYDKQRADLLVKLAAVLNVKSCPYCNMNFTLYIGNKTGLKEGNKARFQFDHFFPKDQYPFLSMSLYNLIPCCGECNHTKRTGVPLLELNPYHNDIHKLFRFWIKDPDAATRPKNAPFSSLKMLLGMDSELDDIEIEVAPTFKKYAKPVSELDSFARLTDQYSRHKDIVQEVYAKRYLKPYYDNPNNFKGMGVTIDPMRLLLGVYTDKKDIEKRPLTKFIQDIWDQAIGKR